MIPLFSGFKVNTNYCFEILTQWTLLKQGPSIYLPLMLQRTIRKICTTFNFRSWFLQGSAKLILFTPFMILVKIVHKINNNNDLWKVRTISKFLYTYCLSNADYINCVHKLVGVTTADSLRAFEYGKHVGIAFQLVDDLLDFVSSADQLGISLPNYIEKIHNIK